MTVFDGLPPPLAQGIFAEARRYPMVMRFSTNPGDVLPDSVSTPRGLAIKVLDVEGERLPGLSEKSSQDFVMVNGPTFNAADGEAFLKNLKMLAATTDRVEGLKKVVSATLRGIE
ncbi:catalase, partial [Rhizobiaceae sp. 2RAB30]